MINCIAFDMDDTLYDEIDYYKSGFAIVARQVAVDFRLSSEEVFHTLCRVFDAGRGKNVFDIAAAEMGLIFKPEYIQKLVQIFREHTPDITLPSDSKAILEQLKGKYKLGLVTDGYLPAQQLKAKALGIEPYFDGIIYTESLGRQNWKPSPAGFEKLLSKLNVPAFQCVYVGDNLEKDFLAPNNLGFKTVRVVRENRIHFGKASTSQAQPQHEIESISKLLQLI